MNFTLNADDVCWPSSDMIVNADTHYDQLGGQMSDMPHPYGEIRMEHLGVRTAWRVGINPDHTTYLTFRTRPINPQD